MEYIRLLKYKSTSIDELKPYINDKAFEFFCSVGNLNLLKWMVENDSDNCINISVTHWNKEFPFKIACANGHLHIAKWIYEVKPDIDISADCEDAFRYVCREGHLEIAKWLYEVKPDIDVSVCFYEPIRYACAYGYLELAQWLYETFPGIDLNICDQYAFPHISYTSHPEIVEWMDGIRNSENYSNANYGALKEIVYSLEVKRKFGVETICPVCYEKADIETSCGHFGCEDCFSKIADHTCPYCRQFITDYFKLVE
jgi:hypothetical protein